MSKDEHNDAKSRPQEFGVSVGHRGRSFPDGAMNGKLTPTVPYFRFFQVDDRFSNPESRRTCHRHLCL